MRARGCTPRVPPPRVPKTPPGALVLLLLVVAPVRAELALPDRVEFNRDIRPILSDACFACHGPDARKRKADLRLYTEEGAFADLGEGRRPFVPGRPDQSEVYRRMGRMEAAAEIGRRLDAAWAGDRGMLDLARL